MDRTLVFRRTLLRRLLGASALALPSIAVVASGACQGQGRLDLVQQCFDPFDLGLGGAAAFDAGPCPSMTQANADRGFDSGNYCSGIQSDGTLQAGLCCYEIAPCGTGRPYVDGGRSRTARPRRVDRGTGRAPGVWGRARLRRRAAPSSPGGTPRLVDLSPELRSRLAAAWTADGLLEHASIASFGRFALELLAVGAPADFVADAHHAALDEVEHTRLCLGLAGDYAGEHVVPSPFPFEGRVEVSADLASIAARTAREGCVGESLGAIQAAEQLAAAEDPCVRHALSIIVADEARHAELSWRFVAWALAHGGAEVRAAVAGAFDEPVTFPVASEAQSPEMIAHGRLDPAALRAVLDRGLDEVVRPCAALLLAAV